MIRDILGRTYPPVAPQVGRVLGTCQHCSAACPAGDTACASCEQIDVIRCSSLGLSEYAVTWGYTSRPGTTEADDVTSHVRYTERDGAPECAGVEAYIEEHVAQQLADWLQVEIQNGRRFRVAIPVVKGAA